MKIKNIKLIKRCYEKNGAVTGVKVFKADAILDDCILKVFFKFDHNKYITDISFGEPSNFSKKIIFSRLKRCYSILKNA